ncbi:MAG: hypothetical protein KTR30_13735 [Saprospiraceae bacterium]|nr:hypothetical protein [Saprospiraceae bacterium]
MPDYLDNIWERIVASDSIGELEKEQFLTEMKALRAQQNEQSFKIKRLLKDKSIAVNILEATIEDLEKKKLEMEQINAKLFIQQQELKAQKGIIEDNAKTLQENLNKLELSYKELEQFSYIASHDLKSPLRTIASFAQLLERRYRDELDDQAREFIDFIVSGVNQMSEVIQGLLQYSHIGQSHESLEEIDLNEVIDLVKSTLKVELEENAASIQFQDLPTIRGNKVGIIQLFQNLIHNAIKFRRANSPIVAISSRYLPEPRQWEFRVADNGMGMSEEFQNKVFLPFQRLNTKKIAGLGIGLAICHKVVKLHGGQIRYESQLGMGTTFVFTVSEVDPGKSGYETKEDSDINPK